MIMVMTTTMITSKNLARDGEKVEENKEDEEHSHTPYIN
jgi:hypothetical protein